MSSEKDPYYDQLQKEEKADDTDLQIKKPIIVKKSQTTTDKKTSEKPFKNRKKESIDFFRDLAIILVIVFVVRSFFILPFQISGSSMDSSYYDREFIIVDRLSYLTYTEPKRGDVVVFNTHREDKSYFIKRIIGIPGDTVKITDGNVFVRESGKTDFLQLDETYLDTGTKTYVSDNTYKKEYVYEIPEWKYFVMGDNRSNSSDSRTCFSYCRAENTNHFVDKKDIVGRVFIDLWYFHFRSFSFQHPLYDITTTPRWFSSPDSFEYWK